MTLPPLSLLLPCSPPCVRPKNLRVLIQNAPVCAETTPACGDTCARGAGTHGDVLNLHTEVFSACQDAPHTPNHTPHTHRTHTTHHTHQHASTHNDRESGQRKREEEIRDKKRQHERQDERQDEEEEKTRCKTREDMKCVVCVVMWLFLFSKLPDPRIISNFQNSRKFLVCERVY